MSSCIRMDTRLVAFLAVAGILLATIPMNLAKMGKFKYVKREKDLPSVYEYFRNTTDNANLTGLTAEADGFKLNGKKLKIISGAMHYFRIHPDLWRDRIKKLRAMGANTLETYIPWQLHEPKMGQFDFGEGKNDMSIFLDVRRYLQIAQEEDLLVLFRPGPYICSEWDFGGLPSWLQRDPDMKVRTNYQPYLDRVKIYFDKLLSLVTDFQFTRGGPIIAVQLENEYGSFSPISKEYLEFLYQLYVDHDFVNETLLFTSDTLNNEDKGTLPDKLLMTANFQGDVDESFKKLKEIQPNKPVFVMEFWAGWFDHWTEKHHFLRAGAYVDFMDRILRRWNGSLNFYMFHGGTNFGFMAGANSKDVAPYYDADVTSYDYDSPLSEAGDYTPKYLLAKTLIAMYQEPQVKETEMIPEKEKTAYPTLEIQQYLTYDDIIDQVPASSRFKTERPVTMENLDINDGSGQSYGYIIYRKVVDILNGTTFDAGPVKDFGMLLIDSQLEPTGYQIGDYWINGIRNFSLTADTPGKYVLDLFVENMGRVNYGNEQDFMQQKGLLKNATYQLNGQDITNIEIIPLEFSSKWVQSISDWKWVSQETTLQAPVMVQSNFNISDEPTDTFIDMSKWHKGIVFVNGFNIGRYFKAGPQQTLYVPGPLLRKGENSIVIFEQLEPSTQITFRDTPNLGPLAEEEWKVCKLEKGKRICYGIDEE